MKIKIFLRKLQIFFVKLYFTKRISYFLKYIHKTVNRCFNSNFNVDAIYTILCSIILLERRNKYMCHVVPNVHILYFIIGYYYYG